MTLASSHIAPFDADLSRHLETLARCLVLAFVVASTFGGCKGPKARTADLLGYTFSRFAFEHPAKTNTRKGFTETRNLASRTERASQVNHQEADVKIPYEHNPKPR